jgi:transcriptional regulator with XRE-family HTH domain
MYNSVAEKIRQIRTDNGISQRELAKKLGLSNRAVSKWESGLSYPSTENLIRIAEVFSVPLEFFFEKAKEESERLMKIARDYAASLMERAKNSDGSFRLAYDKPETFSLKYNAVWDKIWKTGLFPEEFYRGEIERYKKEMLPYGVPLDSREKYTKSDWTVWAACLAENKEDFDFIVSSLWRAYNTTRSHWPLSDWLWCDTSECIMFRHRTVQGGLFIKLMM